MREFDTIRAVIPSFIAVPGSTTIDGQLGDKAVGSNYDFESNGWEVRVQDPGKIDAASAKTSGSYYSLLGYHRSKIEWTPWARSDIALTP